MKKISFENELTLWGGTETETLVEALKKRRFKEGFKSDAVQTYEKSMAGTILRVQLDFNFSIESCGFDTEDGTFSSPDRVIVSFMGIDSVYCSCVTTIEELYKVLGECAAIIYREF